MLNGFYKIQRDEKVSSGLEEVIAEFNLPEILHKVEKDHKRYSILKDKEVLQLSKEEINKRQMLFLAVVSRMLDVFFSKFGRKGIKTLDELLKVKYVQNLHDIDSQILIPLITKFERLKSEIK
jgi:hypothetical protein